MESSFNNRLKTYAGVKVLVLGASGFIGRWVAKNLCMQDAHLTLVVRDAEKSTQIFNKYDIHGVMYEADLSLPGTVQEILRENNPSIVFNLAGYGVDPSERDETAAYRINAELVKWICESLVHIGDKHWRGQIFVHVGSALEYGRISGDLSEDSSPEPTTLYGKSKLAGTNMVAEYCKAHDVKGLTARLFTVYGPGEHPGRLLPSLVEAAKTGQPISLTAGTQRRDFTYVNDVAKALLYLGLSEAQSGEIVNLATGSLTSVREFVEMAAYLLQIPENDLRFGILPTRKEEMEHSEVNLEKLEQLTGWVPDTNIEDGIRLTIKFNKTGI